MSLPWMIASLHLLALPLGLGSVTVRAAALRGPLDERGLRRVFVSDALWGLAALVWISTGVWRAFFGLEKGTAYYVESTAFWYKMSFLALILLLEIAPMRGIVRWRLDARKGLPIDMRRASRYARISMAQAVLVVAMVFAATAMARGLFH